MLQRSDPERDLEADGEDEVSSAALCRLMAWLSPAYPVGSFSYSSGLEWAVEADEVRDAVTLRRWPTVTIGEGSVHCDAVFIRLFPLDQTDGQRVLAALQPVIEAAAGRALATALADVGSAAFRADLASMRHETQYTRLFRS